MILKSAFCLNCVFKTPSLKNPKQLYPLSDALGLYFKLYFQTTRLFFCSRFIWIALWLYFGYISSQVLWLYLIFVPLKIGQVLPKKSVYGENMTKGQVNSGSSIIIFQIGLSNYSTLFLFEIHSYKKALFQVHLYLGFYGWKLNLVTNI